MTIYTSSWFAKLPPQIVRIGISRGIPRNQPPGFRTMRELAPGAWFSSVTPLEYHQRYFQDLGRLDIELIRRKIEFLANDGDAALLCFETGRPGQWCHRAFVSEWFQDHGILVPEWGDPECRCGKEHPLYPEI